MTMITTPSVHGTSTATRTLWRPVALAGLAAAAATTVVAAIAREAGVSLTMDGEPLPLAAFAQLTLVAATLGSGLAVALRRWARRPRRTFTITTVTLTALSFVPDVIASVSAGTRVTLIATHVVAAAIVIPVMALRLPHHRD